jgi:hypothetical protein
MLSERAKSNRPTVLTTGDSVHSNSVDAERAEVNLPSAIGSALDRMADDVDGLTNGGLEAASGELPALFVPACGALCDVFWWARR